MAQDQDGFTYDPGKVESKATCRCRCGSVTLDRTGKDGANVYVVVQRRDPNRTITPDRRELLAVRIDGWNQDGDALVFDPMNGSLRPIQDAVDGFDGPGYHLIGAFRGSPKVAIHKARAKLRAILAGKDPHGLGVVYSEAYDRRE